VNSGGQRKETEDQTFKRVVDYFLGHSKLKNDPAHGKKKSASRAKKAVRQTPKKRG
jgi:hypothetical protein